MNMKCTPQYWLLGLAAAAALTATGCLGGGGGSGFLGSLFGSSESGSSDLVGSSASGGSTNPSASETSGTAGTGSPSIATVRNPEPASVALFGSGLVGVALWRRRKARK